MPRRKYSDPTLFAGGSGGRAAGSGVVLPAVKSNRRRWRKPSNDPTREIRVLGRTVVLSYSDFVAVRAMNGGRMRVDAAESEFRRLLPLGLVRARFENVGDWPVAFVTLTELGQAVIESGFPQE